MATILLGFEVGSGAPVEIPLGHMVVAGQTQLSGKTTLLEAAASRSGRSVLAFRTKRGEGAFIGGARLPAYVTERADWQFVEAILESTMRQKMRFERAWIMRACRGARTLADVQRNVAKLQKDAKLGMDRDMYMMLGEYLAIVVPVLARLPKSPGHAIRLGVNVVDLIGLPEEVQGLVIASWLGRVHESEEGIICLIPEAWKYLPQGRNSPVKMGATRIAREGAALGNLLWMDAQDLAGFEKEHQRGASVFCLGVQREMNEVKRNLALIPAGLKKPKAEDVATLQVGQFMVCRPDGVVKTYIWPAWMAREAAVAVAKGDSTAGLAAMFSSEKAERDQAALMERIVYAPLDPIAERAWGGLRKGTEDPEEDEMSSETTEALRKMTETMDTMIAKIDEVLGDRGKPHRFDMKVEDADPDRAATALGKAFAKTHGLDEGGEDAMFARFRDRLLKDPKVLRVLAVEKRIDVATEVEVIEADGKTLQGRVALMVRDGFFDEPRTGNAVWVELRRRGYPSKANVPPGSLYDWLIKLGADGFLTVAGKSYSTAEGAKKRVKEAG